MSDAERDSIYRAMAGSRIAELEERLARLERVVAVLVGHGRLAVGGGGDDGGDKDKGGAADAGDAGDRGMKGFPFF